MPKLIHNGTRYVYLCEINERFPAKEAGFSFNRPEAPMQWSTDSARRALKLAAYADDEIRARILAEAKSEPDPDRISFTFDGSCYRAFTPFAYKDLCKDAGFQFAREPRPHWYTVDPEAAVRFFNNAAIYEGLFDCDAELRTQLDSHLSERNEALEQSHATNAEIDIPIPDGLELLPFQKAGVRFALRVFGEL
jgi:hypothetical protein